MKKLALIVLLLLTFDWLFRANRSLFTDSAKVVGSINAEMETRGRMEQIGKIARTYYELNQQLPVRDLETVVKAYLRAHRRDDTPEIAQDAWGTIYRVVPSGDDPRKGFDVASAGPDRQWTTSDDIRHHYTLDARGYRASGDKPRR